MLTCACVRSVKDFIEVATPDVDLINRNLHPRMPWHDVHVGLWGLPAIDVAMHFAQRWDHARALRAGA